MKELGFRLSWKPIYQAVILVHVFEPQPGRLPKGKTLLFVLAETAKRRIFGETCFGARATQSAFFLFATLAELEPAGL